MTPSGSPTRNPRFSRTLAGRHQVASIGEAPSGEPPEGPAAFGRWTGLAERTETEREASESGSRVTPGRGAAAAPRADVPDGVAAGARRSSSHPRRTGRPARPRRARRPGAATPGGPPVGLGFGHAHPLPGSEADEVGFKLGRHGRGVGCPIRRGCRSWEHAERRAARRGSGLSLHQPRPIHYCRSRVGWSGDPLRRRVNDSRDRRLGRTYVVRHSGWPRGLGQVSWDGRAGRNSVPAGPPSPAPCTAALRWCPGESPPATYARREPRSRRPCC